jgi:hypothetical protein
MPSPCTVESQRGRPPSSLQKQYELSKPTKLPKRKFSFKTDIVTEQWSVLFNDVVSNTKTVWVIDI